MKTRQNIPYFIWDYNLTQEEVRKIIKEGDEFSRQFIIARILESTKYEDVWKYLSLEDLRRIFPSLKLKEEIKKAWEKAFKAWRITCP